MNTHYTETVTTHYKTKRHSSFLRKLVTVAVVLFILALVFVGCSSIDAAPAADPKASQAAPVTEAPATEEPAEEAPADNLPLVFGETATWDNNVSISVSEPVAFQPTEYAAGMVEGHTSVVFEFVLTNNSGENYEPLIYNTATSGGVDAPGIFDVEKGIDFAPTTVVLPGKTIKWKEAYSVADASDITLEVSAGFEYASAIYTNSK